MRHTLRVSAAIWLVLLAAVGSAGQPAYHSEAVTAVDEDAGRDAVLIEVVAKTVAGTFGGVLGAGIAAYIAYRKWLEKHLAEKWYSILQLGIEHPRFMQQSLTDDYPTQFTGEEAVKYELFARTCVAFVDHMVNSRRLDLDGMYKGTGNLLVGRHKAWVRENLDSYNDTFRDWFERCFPAEPE